MGKISIKDNGIWRNIVLALIAQVITLICSIAIAFIFPKFFNVEQYAYWQLFSFYIGYVGIFHFGFNDGIYLRLGGKHYENLKMPLLKAQINILIVMQIIISVGIIGYGVLFQYDVQRKYVIILVGIYSLVNNIGTCFGYIFQAVNYTRWYSLSIILERVIFCLCAIMLVCNYIFNINLMILCYIISKTVALLYCLFKGRNIILCKAIPMHKAIYYYKSCIKSGIFLMMANLSATLILGIGRFVMDQVWGIQMFGKFSFANSITQFVLLFICQFSMVMFPNLRRQTKEKNIIIYSKIKNMFTYLGLPIYIMYIPCQIFISWWLPQYAESMRYMIILLPICLFDGKMNLLFNTYLKVFHCEKKMFIINITAVLFSIIFALVGAFVFNNEYVIIYGMVISIIFRSIIAEKQVNKLMKLRENHSYWIDVIVTILFWSIFGSIDNISVGIIIYIILCASIYIFGYFVRSKKAIV